MLWIISKQNLLRQVYKRMEQRCAQLGRLSERLAARDARKGAVKKPFTNFWEGQWRRRNYEELRQNGEAKRNRNHANRKPVCKNLKIRKAWKYVLWYGNRTAANIRRWLHDYQLKLTFASVRILQTEKEGFCFENLFQTAQVYFDWLG